MKQNVLNLCRPFPIKASKPMISIIVYLLGVVVLILHFTKFLARRNLDWVVLVAPVAIFAVNILDYLKIL
jgi:hypothetical protein